MFLVYRADDGCFYVGLGSNGQKKKQRGGAPAEYRPFQCCPTKLEKSTRVPKMTAAKIGQSASDGGRKTGGNFKFSSVPSKTTADKGKDNKDGNGKGKGKSEKDKKAEAVAAEKAQLKKGAKGDETKGDKKKAAAAAGNKQALAKAGKEKGGKGQKGLFSIDLNWW